MNRHVVALLMFPLAACSSDARAAISVTYTSQATPGVAAHQTYQLTAHSTAGKIIGFNFDSAGGSGYGIFGALNQENPLGLVTILDDIPPALLSVIETNYPSSDSHFLVKSADGIVLDATENQMSLTAAFNFSNTAARTNSLEFAQVVIPSGSSWQVKGQFTTETASGNILEDVNWMNVPEPSTLVGMAIGVWVLATPGRRRKSSARRVASASLPTHRIR